MTWFFVSAGVAIACVLASIIANLAHRIERLETRVNDLAWNQHVGEDRP